MNTSLPAADYHIGPEDLLQITLFNISDVDTKLTPRVSTVRVSQQGLISLPLFGDIQVAGLTTSDLERELRRVYDKYIHNPQVGVMVAEYRQRVAVIGAVQRTGTIDLTGPKTVIDILSLAGGVTDRAGTQVHIYRQGPDGRESHVIDLLVLASNASLINAENAGLITMPVQGGDVINVPPAGTFFVDGAVRGPGSYPLGRRYSLTQALITAGGVNRDFHSSDITIYRKKGTSEVVPIEVNLNEIVAGTVADPQIEADDVILVPINGFKYAYFKVVGQILGWSNAVGSSAERFGAIPR
jgi:polysaccharide export outer membrane protein